MKGLLNNIWIITLSVCALNANYTTITNTEGRDIDVELLSLDDEQVRFRMRNGGNYTVAMGKLDSKSQKLIAEWHEQASKIVLTSEDRLRISVLTSRDSDDTDGGYTGWKDMLEQIEPELVIENLEYKRGFNKLKATLVLLGQDVTDRNNLKVVFKDTLTFDLPEREIYRWKGTPFRLKYLIDDNDSFDNSYGFRYRYYFLVIENEDGKVGHCAGSMSGWTSNPRLIKKLETNKTCNRNLELTKF
mgnify:FL=1